MQGEEEGYAACIRTRINVYKRSVVQLEWMSSLGKYMCVDMRITLILGLKEMEYGPDWFRSEQIPAVLSGFIKGEDYRDKLSNYYLLKKKAVPHEYS
jgi:hypothetical protein